MVAVNEAGMITEDMEISILDMDAEVTCLRVCWSIASAKQPKN